jgi:hypothetical protein
VNAVRETWTFTRAARWGFTKVTPIVVEGMPGNYSKINVLLEKAEDHDE